MEKKATPALFGHSKVHGTSSKDRTELVGLRKERTHRVLTGIRRDVFRKYSSSKINAQMFLNKQRRIFKLTAIN
jgi:hypothetical protein